MTIADYIELYHQWFLAASVLLIAVTSRILIRHFLLCWHEKIKIFIDEEANASRKEEKESIRQAELVEKRDKKLIYITQIIGFIEMIACVAITVYLLNVQVSSDLDKIKSFGFFLGGWLGIKILSSHRPWSDYIAGKAYYHISLIGTLFNIITGIFVGWLIYAV